MTTIYNFLRKKNYVYKKTKININPYSFGDQKQKLINVYNHLVNKDNSITLDLIKKKTTDLFNNENTSLKRNDIINSTFIIERKNNILKMNNILKQEIEIINYEGIISIDEMSIITNRTCEKGWALKNNECIINIPFLKPNERYSLLMATSKKKIIKYILVKGSIKTDIFISFLNELYNENPYYIAIKYYFDAQNNIFGIIRYEM